MKCLRLHCGQKAYILIDEYDPVNSIITKSILKPNKENLIAIMNKLKGLFSGCGKGNPHRERVLFTGVFDTLKK